LVNGFQRKQAPIMQEIGEVGLAKTGLPVFSSELCPRYFHYASLRLANTPNVRLERADSRRFLRELFDENLLPPGPALFYLDAHWEHDLPLWEEVDQIFSRHPSPVIMADDFRVPTDSGFAYDDYGKGKCLSVSDLHEAVTAKSSMFFPNYASAHETGARRGCVVLAQGDLAHDILRVPMLAKLSLIDALILELSRVKRGTGGNALADLKEDAERLAEAWRPVMARRQSANAPATLYHDLDPVERTMRDEVDASTARVLIDDRAAFEAARAYCRRAIPDAEGKIEYYAGPGMLFDMYDLEEEIDHLTSPRVPLPAGGWITIEGTEALTAIDVNSGSFTASTGPVAPSTSMGMRSHQALNIAIAACIRPTLECTAAAIALPVTLA